MHNRFGTIFFLLKKSAVEFFFKFQSNLIRNIMHALLTQVYMTYETILHQGKAAICTASVGVY